MAVTGLVTVQFVIASLIIVLSTFFKKENEGKEGGYLLGVVLYEYSFV